MSDLFYHISDLCPDGRMGGAGFAVKLWPSWKRAVADRALTQQDVNHAVESRGRAWLDGCGYDAKFDPDNCGAFRDGSLPPGPQAGYLYEPGTSIRVSWGEWGPEHITIPGNACGLDLDVCGIGAPSGGRVLTPHNVDSILQAHLLLVVFLFFADTLVLNIE